jgi:hypothetical protein
MSARSKSKLATDSETQKMLEAFEKRIQILELQASQEKPEGEFELHIGSQRFEPKSFKDGASIGIRYLLFKIQDNADGYSLVHDDLAVNNVLDTTYSEDGVVVLNGKTVEVWQDLRQENYWWAKVDIDAFC